MEQTQPRKKLIIINGPMGVGKTVTGKYIAESCPGTAFIDGDWCMDIHPFVGNSETRAMAADNIIHMIGNYAGCSVCRMIVLVWLMDDAKICQSICYAASEIGLEVISATLVCGEDELVSRWKNDTACEWRTDGWLRASLGSLPYFRSLKNTVDTGGLSVKEAAEAVLALSVSE